MRRRNHRIALLFAFPVACCVSAVPVAPVTKWINIPRTNFCVTEGSVEESPGDGLFVTVSKMRAYLNTLTPQLIDARFTYLGATENEARLRLWRPATPVWTEASRSGRLQFGLRDVAHRNPNPSWSSPSKAIPPAH